MVDNHSSFFQVSTSERCERQEKQKKYGHSKYKIANRTVSSRAHEHIPKEKNNTQQTKRSGFQSRFIDFKKSAAKLCTLSTIGDRTDEIAKTETSSKPTATRKFKVHTAINMKAMKRSTPNQNQTNGQSKIKQGQNKNQILNYTYPLGGCSFSLLVGH